MYKVETRQFGYSEFHLNKAAVFSCWKSAEAFGKALALRWDKIAEWRIVEA